MFDFIKNIPFIDFFKLNSIDVPSCFKKTKSLKRKQDITNLLKLTNYVMTKGLKSRALQGLVVALTKNINLSLKDEVSLTWRNLYLFFSSNISLKRKYLKLFMSNPDSNDDESLYHGINTFVNENSFEKSFFKKLNNFKPIFLFYIYKVDKSIFKNSRGRSGKFTFIWKYITPYKRLLIVYHWLNKELKTINKKNFQQRLDFLLNQILFQPKSTWIYRIRKFSYNYVYYNCRNSLARTYRTTTR